MSVFAGIGSVDGLYWTAYIAHTTAKIGQAAQVQDTGREHTCRHRLKSNADYLKENYHFHGPKDRTKKNPSGNICSVTHIFVWFVLLTGSDVLCEMR